MARLILCPQLLLRLTVAGARRRGPVHAGRMEGDARRLRQQPCLIGTKNFIIRATAKTGWNLVH